MPQKWSIILLDKKINIAHIKLNNSEEIIRHFEAEGKTLPPSRTRPMQEVS